MVVALRPTSAAAAAAAAAVACFFPLPKSQNHPKSQCRARAMAISRPSLAIPLLFTLAAPVLEGRAVELPKKDILASIDKLESALDQAQSAASATLELSQSAIQVLIGALKPAVETLAPVLTSAREKAADLASPVVYGASKQAYDALQSVGVDPAPVVSAAKAVAVAAQKTSLVIEEAKPIASSALQKISSTDPSAIVVSAGALFLAYLLLPPVWSAVSFNLRGYQGDLSSAQALDLVISRNYLLVDIRSEKDKSKAGVPRLPSTAKNKFISIPLEELPAKIKNLVRNTKKVEAELIALKISYLKKANKGSNIVILDSYSDSAKIVAKALRELGFRNCWVVRDGFSGGGGWLQSRLGTDSYNVSRVEVLSPLQVVSTVSGRLNSGGGRKLLPGSADPPGV